MQIKMSNRATNATLARNTKAALIFISRLAAVIFNISAIDHIGTPNKLACQNDTPTPAYCPRWKRFPAAKTPRARVTCKLVLGARYDTHLFSRTDVGPA